MSEMKYIYREREKNKLSKRDSNPAQVDVNILGSPLFMLDHGLSWE